MQVWGENSLRPKVDHLTLELSPSSYLPCGHYSWCGVHTSNDVDNVTLWEFCGMRASAQHGKLFTVTSTKPMTDSNEGCRCLVPFPIFRYPQPTSLPATHTHIFSSTIEILIQPQMGPPAAAKTVTWGDNITSQLKEQNEKWQQQFDKAQK